VPETGVHKSQIITVSRKMPEIERSVRMGPVGFTSFILCVLIGVFVWMTLMYK
jgi:hypothetical protein